MNREKIWEAMSYVWTEIGLDDNDFRRFGGEIAAEHQDMSAFNRAVFWDTCGAFAVETVFALLLMGMALPDWYFPEPTRKIDRWLRRPLVFSLINPLWLIGYPASCIIAASYRLRLRRAAMSSVCAG